MSSKWKLFVQLLSNALALGYIVGKIVLFLNSCIIHRIGSAWNKVSNGKNRCNNKIHNGVEHQDCSVRQTLVSDKAFVPVSFNRSSSSISIEQNTNVKQHFNSRNVFSYHSNWKFIGSFIANICEM